MTIYTLTAIDRRTGFPVEATIRQISAGEAQHEFETNFPQCRVTSVMAR